MAGEDNSENPNSSQFIGNPPSTPDSSTSAGFNTDQLPFNSRAYSDAVDPDVIHDETQEVCIYSNKNIHLKKSLHYVTIS